MDANLTRALLERLGIAEGVAGSELTQQLAGRLQDPIVATLASALLQPRADAEQHDDGVIGARRDVRRRRDALERRLDRAEALLARVADRIGACDRCLGERRRCAACRGTGRPGSSAVRGDVLVRWLEPALTQLGLRIVNETNQERSDTKETAS